MASSTAGNGDLIKAKWLSLDNHIHNVHKKHGELFPKCTHGRLQKHDKMWFKRPELNYNKVKVSHCHSFLFTDTEASEKLSALINNPSLCKDIVQLSPIYQTSFLESFHNVIIYFAPKSVGFSYLGMQSR